LSLKESRSTPTLWWAEQNFQNFHNFIYWNEVDKGGHLAALTTARALGEISGHWDAVYEAMCRKDESQKAAAGH
jgi:hypothetical protein